MNTILCFFSSCSAVHPKAGGGVSAGVWTNTDSHYQAWTAGSGEERCSATTWRASEGVGGTDGRRHVEWTEERGKRPGRGGGEDEEAMGWEKEKKERKEAYFALTCRTV